LHALRGAFLTEARARFVAVGEQALTDIEKTVEGLSAERSEVNWLLRIDAARIVFEKSCTIATAWFIIPPRTLLPHG